MKLNQGSRYAIWSVKAIAFISAPVVAIIAVLVFFFSRSSVYVELQTTLLIIALCLFVFLTIGLYRGVRLERPHKEQPTWTPLTTASSTSPDLSAVGDVMRIIDIPEVKIDLPDVSDAGDDLVGCLVGLVLWVVMSIALVILLPILVQVVWATLFALVLALYWVFYRALRVVFARSRACKGKLLLSTGYGLLYTALYTGWIFVLIWISRYVTTPRG